MDTIERTTAAEAKLLPELPLRLHHNAFVVKDHEANRRFLEDLLGIPLVATWCVICAPLTGTVALYTFLVIACSGGGCFS